MIGGLTIRVWAASDRIPDELALEMHLNDHVLNDIIVGLKRPDELDTDDPEEYENIIHQWRPTRSRAEDAVNMVAQRIAEQLLYTLSDRLYYD